MKFLYIILTFGLLSLTNAFGQTNLDESLIANFSQNVSLSSSTNFFDKTNSIGRPMTSSLDDSQTNLVLIVSHRQTCPPEYTNLISNTNLFSPAEQGLLQELLSKYNKLSEDKSEKFRTKSGGGYDVSYSPMSQTTTLIIQQIKHGRLNGVRVEFRGDHCSCLLRFVDDKTVGKWFEWDIKGNLLLEAEFKKPYDIFGNLNFDPPR